MNPNIHQDLTRLRDELVRRAFDQQGRPLDATLAEVVFKINSCLGEGYPDKGIV